METQRSRQDQEVHIEILHEDKDHPIHITSANADDGDAFDTEVTEIESGKEYEAKVTPKDVSAQTMTRITTTTDYPDEYNPKTFIAYARIKSPPTTQPLGAKPRGQRRLNTPRSCSQSLFKRVPATSWQSIDIVSSQYRAYFHVLGNSCSTR